MSDASAIHEARLAAALASGGYSHDVIYKAALEAFGTAHPRSLLDYGAGVGQFTRVLAQVYPASRVVGADIMDRPAELLPAVGWVASDLNAPLPLEDGSFDAIFSLEVIEHLENPRQVFREISRLLSPGGIAIVTTPNIQSLRSLVSFTFKGYFAQYDDQNYPAHITPLAAIDLTRAAGEAGLRRTRAFFPKLGKIPKILTVNWQDLPVVGSAFDGVLFCDTIGLVLEKAGPVGEERRPPAP